MARGDRQALVAEVTGEDLKARIMRFMRSASSEITPAEEKRLPALISLLPAGTELYVAHTPMVSLGDVVRTSLAVQRAGFSATPHIAARRIANTLTLRHALADLRAGGVEQILLIAGDSARATGNFSCTQDVLECGALKEAGIARIGVAGHPEGHKAVGPMLLWQALEAKQAFAERTSVQMHIVTQFGFNANAVSDWGYQLPRHRIHLPVHVGIAGPAPLPKLIHFAMQCGIGISLRTVMRNLSATSGTAEIAISPDQHLLRLMAMATPPGVQIMGPHFLLLVGALKLRVGYSRSPLGISRSIPKQAHSGCLGESDACTDVHGVTTCRMVFYSHRSRSPKVIRTKWQIRSPMPS